MLLPGTGRACPARRWMGQAAARSPADGYTLFMGILSTQVILPIVRRVPYDPEAGFAPVGPVSTAPMVSFHWKVRWRSLPSDSR